MTANPQWPLLVALVIGLLIGAERERRKGETGGRSAAGLRTFAAVALLGGVARSLGDSTLLVMAGGFVVLAALAAYILGDREDPGLTTEVALVLTYVLGAFAQVQPALALEAGLVVTALLAFRAPLHRFVRAVVSEQEVVDALIFAICAVVILPMLPNRPVDPFGLLNPFTLWRLGVVAMALSWVGHIARRLAGARYGLLVAGLASGLVSSTAAVASMAGLARQDPARAPSAAAGAVASMASSLAYLAAILGAVSPRLLALVAIPFGLAAAVVLAYAAWLVRAAPAAATADTSSGRAFNGHAVLLFVALIGGFSLVSELLNRGFGASGALAGAVIMGLADAHATGVSMATLAASGRLDPMTAAVGVILGLTANMAIKIPTAFTLGVRPFAARVTIGVVLLLAGLWAGCGVAVALG